MGDAQKMILQNIVVGLVAMVVNLLWDCFKIHISFDFSNLGYNFGTAQIMILIFSGLFVIVNLNRWRYYS